MNIQNVRPILKTMIISKRINGNLKTEIKMKLCLEDDSYQQAIKE